MVCPPATSEAGARWPRFGLVVATTTSRRDNKDQMIRPMAIVYTVFNNNSILSHLMYNKDLLLACAALQPFLVVYMTHTALCQGLL
jgi:hypothetical protein